MCATLSVCMIVRDEESVLARCLEGVTKFADEIIIVDTGSLDDTRNIALRYTDKVFDFTWVDDFAKARNAAYERACMDYIMWLDADDVVEPGDAERLNTLKASLPGDIDVVFLLYGGDRDDVNIFNNSTLMRDRLIKRTLSARWTGRIHETLLIPQDAKAWFSSDIRLVHRKLRVNDPERNERIYRLVQAEQPSLSSRDRAFLCGGYYARGEFERAIAEYEAMRGDSSAPDMHNALCYYVWSLKALGRTDELIAALEDLRNRGLSGELLSCELGAAYLQKKRYDDAERALIEALETPVDHSDLLLHFDAYDVFLPSQKLSKLYAAKGDMQTAYAYHQRAARVYPENPGIRINERYFKKALALT